MADLSPFRHTPESLVNVWPQFCQAEALHKAIDISGAVGIPEALEVNSTLEQVQLALLELGLVNTLNIPSEVPRLRNPCLDNLQVAASVVVFDATHQDRWDKGDGSDVPAERSWMCDVGLIIPQHGLDRYKVKTSMKHAITLHATSGINMPTIGSAVTVVTSEEGYDATEDILVYRSIEYPPEVTLGFLSLIGEMTATAES